MPRTARASVGNVCYHAMSRGNNRMTVFDTDADYRAFLNVMAYAKTHVPMRIWSYCLMPNHFHIVLCPYADGDLGRWMHRLLSTHVRRHHRVHKTCGRVWQGRFKAFPIQLDTHLLTVLRYVERNPLRAGLVASAVDWRWSSIYQLDAEGADDLCDPLPIERPRPWIAFVDQPQSQDEVDALRRCVHGNVPFGTRRWVTRTARSLGLRQSA